MKDFDFYIVPTPIGNLGDITLRALDILRKVDVIACEDMRVTQKLLNHFDIKTKCISYHKFNEKERLELFLEILNSGKKMALVSDAGTPLFCDPGSILVEELRKNDIKITALPGANAVVTFLSQVPRADEPFTFTGFLPRTKTQLIEVLKQSARGDVIFYESPNRLMDTLEIIFEYNPQAKIAIGRELTKVFEEVVIDNVQNVKKHFTQNPLKGEVVGMIYRSYEKENVAEIKEKITLLKGKNFKAKEISTILSALYSYSKNDVYKLIIND